MAPSSSPPSDSPFAKGGESVVAAVLAEDERASGLAHDALVAGLNGTVSEVVKRRLRELYESAPSAVSLYPPKTLLHPSPR